MRFSPFSLIIYLLALFVFVPTGVDANMGIAEKDMTLEQKQLRAFELQRSMDHTELTIYAFSTTPHASRSASFNARLICRTQDRYLSSYSSHTTRTILVQRLALQQRLPLQLVHAIILDTEFCSSLWNPDAPHLFYYSFRDVSEVPKGKVTIQVTDSGSHNVQTAPSEKIQDAYVQDTDSTDTIVKSAGKREEVFMSHTPVTDRIADQIEDESMEKKAISWSGDGRARILCRIQQRADDSTNPGQIIRDTATVLSERWGMERVEIEHALRHPKLCKILSAVWSKEALADTDHNANVQKRGAEATPDTNDATQADDKRAAALPPLLLLVIGLAVATLIVLLLILFLPWEIEEEQSGNSKAKEKSKARKK